MTREEFNSLPVGAKVKIVGGDVSETLAKVADGTWVSFSGGTVNGNLSAFAHALEVVQPEWWEIGKERGWQYHGNHGLVRLTSQCVYRIQRVYDAGHFVGYYVRNDGGVIAMPETIEEALAKADELAAADGGWV